MPPPYPEDVLLSSVELLTSRIAESLKIPRGQVEGAHQRGQQRQPNNQYIGHDFHKNDLPDRKAGCLLGVLLCRSSHFQNTPIIGQQMPKVNDKGQKWRVTIFAYLSNHGYNDIETDAQ